MGVSPEDLEEDVDPPRRTRAQLFAALRSLYGRADRAYAGYSCPSSAECCQLAARKREPWLWPIEWQLLEESLRAEGRSMPPARADGGCAFLDAEGRRCTVYASRPFGCRTFFCDRATGPRRQPLEEVVSLLRQLEALSLEHDPTVAAPVPISAC